MKSCTFCNNNLFDNQECEACKYAKERIQKELENSLAYHRNQLELNRELNCAAGNTIAYHHDVIIDFIEHELKERLKL